MAYLLTWIDGEEVVYRFLTADELTKWSLCENNCILTEIEAEN